MHGPQRSSIPLLGTQAGWGVVALCFLVAMLEGVDVQAAGLVAPRIAPLFHLTPGQLGLFFSAGTLGLVIGALAGGWVADRIGRKIPLIVSTLLFGAASLAMTTAASFGPLAGLRFVTGLGLGGALPNLIAISSESVGAARRNLAIGLMYCGMPFGGGVASLLMGLGIGAADWRTVFYAGGALPVIVAPLLAFALPGAKSATPTAVDVAGEAKLLRALFGEGRLLRSLALWTAFFCGLLILYLLLNWLPTLLASRGLSRSQASLVQAVFNLSGAAGAVGLGALMDGRRRVWSVAIGFGGLAVGLWGLAAAPAGLATALLFGGLVGASAIGAQAVFFSLSASLYPISVRATGLGTAVAAGRLGSIAGPLLAGVLVGAGRSAGEVLATLLPLAMLSGTLSVLLALNLPIESRSGCDL